MAVERAFNATQDDAVKVELGAMSVELSWLEEGLVDSLEDWKESHEEDLEKILRESDNG